MTSEVIQTCTLCGGHPLKETSLPSIFACPDCTALLNHRSHSRAEEEQIYLTESFDTALELSKNQAEWFRQIVSEAAIEPGYLVDFGCGTGGFLWQAEQIGWEVAGLEINPESAQKAGDRLGRPVFSGSFYDYPGPTRPADVVTFWDSLDHLLQPDEALSRAHSWLRAGGGVVIRVRNGPWHYWARRVQGALRKLGLLRSRRYVGVIHRYGFTRKSLARLLAQEGFGEIRWYPADLTAGDRYFWFRSMTLRHLLVQLYFGVADSIYRLTGGRFYPFASLLVYAKRRE
ncbi:MAG: hypothetical protein AMXMBFR33_46140 [Candidatus Xenobia bacterium]